MAYIHRARFFTKAASGRGLLGRERHQQRNIFMQCIVAIYRANNLKQSAEKLEFMNKTSGGRHAQGILFVPHGPPNGYVEGDVVVARSPCTAPWDVRKLRLLSHHEILQQLGFGWRVLRRGSACTQFRTLRASQHDIVVDEVGSSSAL